MKGRFNPDNPKFDDRKQLYAICTTPYTVVDFPATAEADKKTHPTYANRWKRWSDKGLFARMMAGLAADQGAEKMVMILLGTSFV